MITPNPYDRKYKNVNIINQKTADDEMINSMFVEFYTHVSVGKDNDNKDRH
jgi:hypothetical protein